jgi:hypothetical protein
MYTRAKTLVEADEVHKFCDICKVEIPIGLSCSAARCEMCGADLCENCIGHEGSWLNDVRTVWCKSCWEIGEPYRKQLDELRQKRDEIKTEWHRVAKARVGELLGSK